MLKRNKCFIIYIIYRFDSENEDNEGEKLDIEEGEEEEEGEEVNIFDGAPKNK